MLNRRNKKFVSELDQFLLGFDQKNPGSSDSQLKEITKHQRIAELRDVPYISNNKSKIWEKF